MEEESGAYSHQHSQQPRAVPQLIGKLNKNEIFKKFKVINKVKQGVYVCLIMVLFLVAHELPSLTTTLQLMPAMNPA